LAPALEKTYKLSSISNGVGKQTALNLKLQAPNFKQIPITNFK